jgi:branched-chain amino acid aminotransferase
VQVYIDGKLVPESEAKISVLDHGLLYGDGIFEGIRAYNGKIFRLKEQLDRRRQRGLAITVNLPWRTEELPEAIKRTLRANELRDGYIRLVVTRGKGDLGLDPASAKPLP